MDRATVYTQEQGRSVDFLFAQRATLIALARLSQAAFGSGTIVRGLAVTPNSPAALNVVVGIGEIYTMAQVDATTWGALGADTTDIVLKQGLNMSAQTVSTPAPTTSGYSINYLIEAQYQDQDTNPVLLPFYNSNNPQEPLNGQGGNGAALPTQRQGVCVIQAKAGVAATTGTQLTPTVDSGWTALAVVTVANGQSTVTSGNISVPGGVPQITSLLQMMQTGSTGYAVDTSSIANTITLALSPAITTYTDGQEIAFKAANTNTGPCTINAGGGSVNLIGAAGALQGNEIVAGKQYTALYSSSLNEFVLNSQTGGAHQINPATQPEHAAQLQQVGHGQCRLSVSSATQLLLSPCNGNNVIVNGVPLQLPAAGVPLANTGLAASTWFYIYLSGTTAAPVLNASTTGYTTNSSGVKVCSTNAAWTYVGSVFTTASSQFVDSPTNRQCISNFNRQNKRLSNSVSNVNLPSGTLAEATTSIRCSFIAHADEAVNVWLGGEIQVGTAGASITYKVNVDGTQDGDLSGSYFATANAGAPIASRGDVDVAEGTLHYVTAFAEVSTGTGTFLQAYTRGTIRG
jgi:hypothetical protein